MTKNLKDTPFLNERKINAPKILSPDETPIHLQDMMESLRKHGQKSAENGWDIAIDFIHRKLGKSEISGNDALSLMATCVTYYVATWILLMKKIADSDEAGIETEEMIQGIIDCAQKLIKTASY